MGTKTSIVLLIAAVLLVVVVGGAWAYDSSQKDKIADGVTIGGVDVGGLDEDEAAAKVHRKLVAPLRSSLKVSFDGETWKLTGKQLKIRADIDAAVAEAVEDSQEGGLPGRLVRYVSGGEVEESISPEVAYSVPAVNRFVRPSPKTSTANRRTPTSKPAATRSRSSPARTAASCATTSWRKTSRRRSSTPTPRTRSSPRSTRPSRK